MSNWIGWGLLILVIVAFFAWGFPAYKSVVKERDDLKTENQRLKSSVDTVTYYPNGKKETETHIRTETAISSTDSSRVYSKTVTKRGTFTLCAYMNLDKDIAASVSYQVIGPVNIAVAFAGGKPYLGCGLSF